MQHNSRVSSLLWLLCLVVMVVAAADAKRTYHVTAQRSFNVPIISSQNHDESTFMFNYNTAYAPIINQQTGKVSLLLNLMIPLYKYEQATHGLIVRCQNQTAGALGPSMLSFTYTEFLLFVILLIATLFFYSVYYILL